MQDQEVPPLEALVAVARSAIDDPLDRFLSTVADTIQRAGGYGCVVVNLFRPACNDYQAVLALGDEGVKALEGTTSPRSIFERMFAEEDELLPGVYFLTSESSVWEEIEQSFTPEIPSTGDPDAWRAEDGLLVFLEDSRGRPQGFVSLDRPASGRRPGDDEVRLVRALCDHVQHALETANRADHATENQRVLSLLLAASPALTACTTTIELLDLAASTVVPDLGFHRFAGYALADGLLKLCATSGWERQTGPSRRLDPEQVESLLQSGREYAGCYLLDASALYGEPADRSRPRSSYNGVGPGTWHDHCLVAPLRGTRAGLSGLIVIEDPDDRLSPGDDRRRAVRLLIDQVAGALISIEQRERLNYLASHDALTGVRNRRGLNDAVSAQRDVALLICDLDRFKQVNDRYGHDLGDQVLVRFGELLRNLARSADIAMRLGGEEFCLVLPNTNRYGAMQVAERLRRETPRWLAELVPGGITVSIGVATSSDQVVSPQALLAAADRGLYAAKAAGRDRSILSDLVA